MIRLSLFALALATVPALAAAQTPPAPASAATPAPGSGMSVDMAKKIARDRLMMADTDGDGKISKAEFLAMRGGMGGGGGAGRRRGGAGAAGGDDSGGGAMANMDPALRIAIMAKAFDRLDTNHDGFLDATEIDTEIAQRVERLDTNHDGMISADERRAMRGAGGMGGGGDARQGQ